MQKKITRKFVDISGKTFNDLQVLEYIEQGKQGYYMFKCRCICGKICEVAGATMKSGHTKSCGCRNSRSAYKHGMSNTKLWNAWRGMFKRTKLKSRRDYKDYGGRGITVCRRWEKFENFRDDMEITFNIHCKIYGEKNTSLDREDNNKGYSSRNCRWATAKQQANNRRGNHLITYKGTTLTATQWAEDMGLAPNSLVDRIQKLGWSVEKALETPRRNYNRHI